MIATGRKPNTEGLGLENAGVKFDHHKGIFVNNHLQTSNPNIFSCGDICTDYKFTHIADSMARIVIRNALFFGNAKFSQLVIPWSTYTEPEVAHVGAHENDLISAGVKFKSFCRNFSSVDRAIVDGAEGFVKVFVKEGTDKILGATIVGPHAGDMISEITTSMVAGVGLGTIATIIHPYPTLAEAIRQLGDEFNRTKLTPNVKIIFRKLLTLRR